MEGNNHPGKMLRNRGSHARPPSSPRALTSAWGLRRHPGAVMLLLLFCLCGDILSPFRFFAKADRALRGDMAFFSSKTRTFAPEKPPVFSSLTTSRHVAAWSRVGASFHDAFVLSDIDDTLWSSGAWRVGKKTLGGVDEDLLRGQTYPGIAALFFLLSNGPHVTTSSPNVCIAACPEYIRSPLLQTCPVSPFDGETVEGADDQQGQRRIEPSPYPPSSQGSRALRSSSSSRSPRPLPPSLRPAVPPRIGLLTARASTSALKAITRPASFYTGVDLALVHGARQMYWGPHREAVEGWGEVAFENDIEFLRDFLGGQHTRGRAKIAGYKKALGLFPQRFPVFFGDLGERDVEVGAGIALYDAKRFVAMFAHVVFDTSKKALSSSDSTRVESTPSVEGGEAGQEAKGGVALPPHALAFDFDFNGRRIPAVQFTYNIQARLHHKDPEPRSFEELSDTHLYSAGMRVGQELKRFMLAYARDNLQALAEGKPPRPLPIFFVKFDQLEVRRLDGLHPQATGNPLKRLYRKLTVGIRKGVSRMLSIKWDEEKDIAAYTEVVPVLRKPGEGPPSLQSQKDLGVPFVPYRGTLGAGISAFLLEMITLPDLVNLALAVVRDYRSMGPPDSCPQRDTLDELLWDLRLMKTIAGDALTAENLDNIDLFNDAVLAVEAFQARADHMCYDGEDTPLGVSWLESRQGQACMASFGFQKSRGPDTVVRIPPEIAPLVRFTCENLDKLKHWKSMGGEELEVLTLGFSLALNEAVAFSNSNKNRGYLSGEEQEQRGADTSSLLQAYSAPPLSSSLPLSGLVNASDPYTLPWTRNNESSSPSDNPEDDDAYHVYPSRSLFLSSAPSSPFFVIPRPLSVPAKPLVAPQRLSFPETEGEGPAGTPHAFESAVALPLEPSGREEQVPEGGSSLRGRGSSLSSSSSGSAAGFAPPAEECPWNALHSVLRDMRYVCGKQKKSKTAKESPCAVMHQVLYREGLLRVFEKVANWLTDGAERPLYLDDLHLVVDPVRGRVDDWRKKESGHFRTFGKVGLSRGRGHNPYDLEEVRARHQGTPFVFSSILNDACSLYAA